MSVVMEVYVRGYEKAIRIESKEMFVVYLSGASGYTHYDYKGVGTCLGRSKGISVVIGNMHIVGVLKDVSTGRFSGQFVKWKRYNLVLEMWERHYHGARFSLLVHWCSEKSYFIGKVQRHHQSRKWEC